MVGNDRITKQIEEVGGEILEGSGFEDEALGLDDPLDLVDENGEGLVDSEVDHE